jgi:hypothetical protein
MPAAIKRLVVRMMENCSFEHTLGFMPSATFGIDGLDRPRTRKDRSAIRDEHSAAEYLSQVAAGLQQLIAGVRSNRVRCAAMLFSVILMSRGVYAGDWDHVKQACKNAKDALNAPRIEDCAIKFYGLTPVGPQIGSIGPQGSLGLGLRARGRITQPASKRAKPGTKSKESDFLVRGLYSPSNFYRIEGQYDFKMPALGQGNARTATFADQIDIRVFASRLNLAKQRFYGLGENTVPTALSVYRQLQNKIGVSADWPLTSWLEAGGTLQWVRPTIMGVSGTSVPSVGTIYRNPGAPGIVSQPSFMNYKTYVDVHTSSSTTQTWQRTKLRATYEHFTDLDSKAYTFNRMSASAATSFDLRRKISAPTLPWWKSMLCEPMQTQCSMGELIFGGLATASYLGSASSVPFYFQPTLGGTDINGVDTLRGLLDFRLRAPNRVLLQTQFDHHLWSFIGISGFYDLGKVAADPGDLGLSHLRHDFGVGAFFKIQNKVVVRTSVGFGGGEGVHPNLKVPDAMWGSWETMPMATFP